MKLVRLNLFWKLGLAYLGLLLAVLLAVDFYAERVLQRNYERAGFEQLASLAQIARAHPPQFHFPLPSQVPSTEDSAGLIAWKTMMSAGGARVTVITSSGVVLADSQADPSEMENHAGRPEVREAFASGEGRSIRHSKTIGRDLLYLAIRQDLSSGPPVVLRFAIPLQQIDAELQEVRTRLWGASLVILLLAGGASLLVSRSFSSRVERLKVFSRRVADGDFAPLRVEKRRDALDELAESLNETAGRLDQTIRSLTEERNLSSAILGSMVEGVAVISSDERLVFANQAFSQILGHSATAIEGRTAVEAIRQTDLLTAIREVLAGCDTVHCEVTMGTVRPRSFAATTSAVRSGNSSGAVLVLYDISEVRRLERVRRDFVANVSHEFKTPLTAIQGFAETLLGGALEDEKNRRRFLEIILEHAGRLARLTDDLLKLSQIEAERLELDSRAVPVSELVAACLDTARFRAEQKKLTLRVECPSNLPMALADRGRLSEVLQNLLDNAIQYTPPEGQITVRARAEDHRIIFSVSDTGIGIPQSDQARIFERFYRVDAARSREVGGTGLGLSIAKHIVEAHGGRIWVESKVGQGSDFYFSVPAVNDSPASQAPPQAE